MIGNLSHQSQPDDTRVGDESQHSTIATHPLGVKPSGNAFTAPKNLKASSGLFALLPDELLILALEYLDSHSLSSIGATCKALYAFSRYDELWKSIFVA